MFAAAAAVSLGQLQVRIRPQQESTIMTLSSKWKLSTMRPMMIHGVSSDTLKQETISKRLLTQC